MFERFSGGLRQVVFYARDAAFNEGSGRIEPSHLLAGLEREDKMTAENFIAKHPVVELLRRQRQCTGPSTIQINIKFSERSKDALKEAAAASDAEKCHVIDINHLLIGLLNIVEAPQ